MHRLRVHASRVKGFLEMLVDVIFFSRPLDGVLYLTTSPDESNQLE